MNRLEMIEKLCRKAGVSFDDARAALEACQWDLLDAMLFLQSQGRGRSGTKAQQGAAGPGEGERRPWQDSEFVRGLWRIWKFLCLLVRKGNAHSFVISNRRQEELITMPVTVLALLLIGFWPWGWVALIAGLFLGGRYAFRGPDMGKRVNDAMDKAADMAQGIDGKKKE